MTAPFVILDTQNAAAMASLHAHTFPPSEVWSEKSFADTLAQPTSLALGIEADDQLIAFILLLRTGPDAELLTLATRPDARRKGHADALISSGCALLGSYGTDRLLLEVAEDNHAARALYERKGFAVDGRRKGYYARPDGNMCDGLLMSRSVAGQKGESKA